MLENLVIDGSIELVIDVFVDSVCEAFLKYYIPKGSTYRSRRGQTVCDNDKAIIGN
jgi:hypothetical protein